MRIFLTSTVLAVALAFAVPAHAGDGHGRSGDHYRHGHHKHYHDHYRHARGRYHYREHPPAWGARREVNNYYYGGPAASIPAGVHVIFPSIFFPWQ
jgi:hypothetical protein